MSNGSSSVNVFNADVKRSVRMMDLPLCDASSACVKLTGVLHNETPEVENDMLLLTFVIWELLDVEAFYF